MKIYIAGPMRGCPDFNFPAFEEAVSLLRSVGHDVFFPAEKESLDDLKTHGPEPLSEYMARDLPEVCRADAIAVLPGWESSEGAGIETFVAKAVGKPVKDFHEFLTCWCGLKCHQIVSGDRNVLECPLHSTACHQDSPIRELESV